MTDSESLEERLESIDAEIDELSSRSTGFDLVSGVRRLRAALLGGGESAVDPHSRQFSSKRERAERIRELQQERETVLRQLAEQQDDESPDRPEDHSDTADGSVEQA